MTFILGQPSGDGKYRIIYATDCDVELRVNLDDVNPDDVTEAKLQELVRRLNQRGRTTPHCACRVTCGDVAEADDDALATCKLLPSA